MLDFKAKMHQIMGSLQLTALPRAQAGLKGKGGLLLREYEKGRVGEGEGKEGEPGEGRGGK